MYSVSNSFALQMNNLELFKCFILVLSYDNAGVPSFEGERIDSRGTVSYNYYQVHLMLTSRQKEVKCVCAST